MLERSSAAARRGRRRRYNPVHHCIGALLARQEMKCAIKEIVNNVESLELAVPPDQLDLSNTMVILRGLKSLPVRLRSSGE